MKTRAGIVGLGVLAGLYGAYLLLSRQDFEGNLSAVIWIGLGVILHDFVLTPITLLVLAIGVRVLPVSARLPAAVGLVVLGAVTLLAVPVLGRFGARDDNATLLDRDYGTGWLVFAGATLVAVVVASVLRARQATED